MKITYLGELEENISKNVGGKAKGLDFLKKHGFPIADGFIISDIDSIENTNSSYILSLFDKLNTEKVAVRSSASNEDGLDYSSAGQYETILNVTKDNIIDSIKKCLDSLNNDRATNYSENFSSVDTRKMNIVIEKMVDAKYAGVMFTVSPSSKDKVLIECVEGLGEKLVNGSNNAEQYEINKNNFDYNNNGNKLLSEKQVKELYDTGKKISKEYSSEADLEWAIDKNDNLIFLQLRPITTLEEVSLDEFDSTNKIDNHMLTMRNIGEMLPGAVTPLSISTSVLAIDYGMRDMLATIGSIKNVNSRPEYYCALPIQGHLFIDMTALHSMQRKVLGANAKSTNFSILGEYKEDCPKPEGKNAFIITRFINMLKFGKYLFSSKKAKSRLTDLYNSLSINNEGNSKEIYNQIDKNIHILNEALSCHYVCSSFSGAMNSALFITFEKYFKNKSEFQSFVSEILSSIDYIESVDILSSLRKIATAIYEYYPDAKNFDAEKIQEILSTTDSEKIKNLYKEFLNIHGHRSIKEAEMRSKAWKNDLPALSEYLYSVMKQPKPIGNNTINKVDLKKLSLRFKGSKRSTFLWIAKNARQAVVDREFSKSRIIKIIDKFKDSYISLANKMVEEKLLIDTDMIYFLTHKEISLLIAGDFSLKKKALMRRNIFKEQERLQFEDICIGKPQPINDTKPNFSQKLYGVPVCKGKVYGIARIVHTASDASKLEKGEIMVASFTDIGWSPYYSLLGALITEVGSALSHGAVVAREYALPTVVNVKNATQVIKSGDYLYIDGASGEILKLSKEEYMEKAV